MQTDAMLRHCFAQNMAAFKIPRAAFTRGTQSILVKTRSIFLMSARVTLRKVLLACGVLYSLLYVVLNDAVAATRYEGYSRMSQAISELSARGAPTRPLLTAMLPICSVLMIAFGIGVWQSAHGKRALRVTGGLLVALGVTAPLWLLAPMSQREVIAVGGGTSSDTMHIVLTAVTVLLILSQIGFGAAAFGKRFRLYSILTAATVLVFGALTGVYSSRLAKGNPPPGWGLSNASTSGRGCCGWPCRRSLSCAPEVVRPKAISVGVLPRITPLGSSW